MAQRKSRNSASGSVPQKLSEASRRRHQQQAARQDAAFLKGPLPLAWIIKAASLPGKYPLAVGLAIWFRSGLENKQTGIPLTTKTIERFHVNRQAGYRALATLEAAGLVSVDRKPGRCPLVSIRKVKAQTQTRKGK